MALPRPSLTLILDIDQRLDSEALRLEIARSYSHVGPTLVRTHEASENDTTSNIAHFLVKLGSRSYLRSEGKETDDLWNQVMERWFYHTFGKVGNNMRIYNRRQREIGGTELIFDWLDIDLQNGSLHTLLRLDSCSGIDPEASALLTVLRNILNDGTLGGEVVEVMMPSTASYEDQKAAGFAAKARHEAEEAARVVADEEVKRKEREAIELQADEEFLESPELMLSIISAQGSELKENRGESIDEMFEFSQPDFPIDYRVWSVKYADGTMREFDSLSCSFTIEGGFS
jgi:hypothetical protein